MCRMQKFRNFEKVAQLSLADELAKIDSDSEGYEFFNGVYFTSTSIADVMIEPTSSVPVYSIVLLASLAGITIISTRFLVKRKE